MQKAIEDYNRLIALHPTYPVGYRERAKIYEKLDGKKSPRVVSDYAIVKAGLLNRGKESCYNLSSAIGYENICGSTNKFTASLVTSC